MNKFELIGTVKQVYLDSVDIECDGELLEVQLNEAMCKYFIEIGDQLHIKGKITELQKKQIDGLLQKYGLYDFRNSYPNELSGGMRQRVG